jgi:hypothetical protein
VAFVNEKIRLFILFYGLYKAFFMNLADHIPQFKAYPRAKTGHHPAKKKKATSFDRKWL